MPGKGDDANSETLKQIETLKPDSLWQKNAKKKKKTENEKIKRCNKHKFRKSLIFNSKIERVEQNKMN